MRTNLFLLCSLIWLMTGCFNRLCPNPDTDLLELSSDARQWLTYSSGQTLLFGDEAGIVDTITVVQYTDTIDTYWQGDECPERPQEVVHVAIAHKNRLDTLVSVSGEYGNALTITSKNIRFTYFTDTSRPSVNISSASYRYATSLLLNGRTFLDVLTVVCASCDPTDVSEFYFSKNIGLAGYRKSGKLWVRQ